MITSRSVVPATYALGMSVALLDLLIKDPSGDTGLSLWGCQGSRCRAVSCPESPTVAQETPEPGHFMPRVAERSHADAARRIVVNAPSSMPLISATINSPGLFAGG